MAAVLMLQREQLEEEDLLCRAVSKQTQTGIRLWEDITSLPSV